MTIWYCDPSRDTSSAGTGTEASKFNLAQLTSSNISNDDTIYFDAATPFEPTAIDLSDVTGLTLQTNPDATSRYVHDGAEEVTGSWTDAGSGRFTIALSGDINAITVNYTQQAGPWYKGHYTAVDSTAEVESNEGSWFATGGTLSVNFETSQSQSDTVDVLRTGPGLFIGTGTTIKNMVFARWGRGGGLTTSSFVQCGTITTNVNLDYTFENCEFRDTDEAGVGITCASGSSNQPHKFTFTNCTFANYRSLFDFLALGNDTINIIMEDCTAYLTGLTKLALTRAFEDTQANTNKIQFFDAGSLDTNDAVRVIKRRCTFNGHSAHYSVPWELPAGITDTPDSADRWNPLKYDWILEDCTFNDLHTIFFDTPMAFRRCFIHTAHQSFGTFKAFDTGTAAHALFEMCMLISETGSGTVDTSSWALLGAGHTYLNNCWFLELNATGTDELFESSATSVLHARRTMFYRSTAGDLFGEDSGGHFDANSVDMDANWYYQITDGQYSPNASFNSQAEWAASIDTSDDAIFGTDPEVSAADLLVNYIVTPDDGGNLRTSRHGTTNDGTWPRMAFNRQPYSRHYGHLQYGAPALHAD